MASTSTEDLGREIRPTAGRPLPEFVDWLLAALVALAGLAMVVGGSVLAFVIDRSVLAEAIESGELVADSLTDAELLELTLAVTTWTGVGILVAGLAMVLGAVGYLVVRHRAHQRAAGGEPVSSYGANALLGAVVTAILGFVPLSPAIGGAVAGYIEHGESERTVSVGALSGLLAAAPLLVVMVFALVGLVVGTLAIEGTGMAIVVGAAMLLGVLVLATVGALVGAIGGYLGGRLATRRTGN